MYEFITMCFHWKTINPHIDYHSALHGSRTFSCQVPCTQRDEAEGLSDTGGWFSSVQSHDLLIVRGQNPWSCGRHISVRCPVQSAVPAHHGPLLMQSNKLMGGSTKEWETSRCVKNVSDVRRVGDKRSSDAGERAQMFSHCMFGLFLWRLKTPLTALDYVQ